jgi:SAM-dependent methyltransferase
MHSQEFTEADFRDRIYGKYVHSRVTPLAPPTVQELKPRKANLTKLIREHFPKERNASIVELGCGHGALLYFAQNLGYTNLRGFDASPEQVEAARQLGIENVVEGDLYSALDSYPSGSVDAVIAFDVIEHMRKEELLRMVDSVHRVLRPGGKWIIHTVNGESPFASRMRYWDVTHEMAFTRTSIGQLLLSSGFKAVRSYEEAPVPHGVKSAVRFVLWKGIRFAWQGYLLVETGGWHKQCVLSQNFLTVATK